MYAQALGKCNEDPRFPESVRKRVAGAVSSPASHIQYMIRARGCACRENPHVGTCKHSDQVLPLLACEAKP
jgi:hypothetical protein